LSKVIRQRASSRTSIPSPFTLIGEKARTKQHTSAPGLNGKQQQRVHIQELLDQPNTVSFNQTNHKYILIPDI
jgi:hypothetical protein